MDETVLGQFPVSATVGKLKLVGNATVHVNEQNPLVLYLDDLIVEFDFVPNKEIKGGEWSASIKGEKGIVFSLHNFINPVGEGVLDPVKIGTTESEGIYLSFWVITPNPTLNSRIFNYSVYLGEL